MIQPFGGPPCLLKREREEEEEKREWDGMSTNGVQMAMEWDRGGRERGRGEEVVESSHPFPSRMLLIPLS